MNVADDFGRRVASVAEGILVTGYEGEFLVFDVADAAEAPFHMGVDVDGPPEVVVVSRLETAGLVGTQVRIMTGQAVHLPLEGIDAVVVIGLHGPVTEIAQLNACGHEFHSLAFFGPRGVTEGAGPVVAGVGRTPLEHVAVALPAELLPLEKKIGLLRAGKAPQQGKAGVGGVNEMTGRADDGVLPAFGSAQGEVLRQPRLDGCLFGPDVDGMQVFLFIVTDVTESRVVGLIAIEGDGLTGVDTETGRGIVAEVAFQRVVGVWLGSPGDRREEQDDGANQET